MTPTQTSEYLTDTELSELFTNLYEQFPAIRCDDCPAEIQCIGYHDEDWTMSNGGNN